MRSFYYQHLLPTGQLKSGIEKLAFDNPDSARLYMERRSKVTVVKLVMMPAWTTYFLDFMRRFFSPPMNREEQVDFFHSLAVMQRSGIPIVDAMEELASEDSNKPTRKIASEVLESLRSGASLSESLDRHSDDIPVTARHLVEIGESSGNLDRTLMDAANHLKRIGRILKDTKRVMIYPVFVFLSIFLAALFWIVYVIPNIADLFRQMKVELPAITRWVLEFSEGFSANLLWVAVILVVVWLVFLRLKHRSQRFRYRYHQLLLKLPVSKVLIKSSSLAFITEYLSLLISSGISIVESLAILERSVKNEVYREKIRKVHEGVSKGNSLSSEIRAQNAFPGFVARMISVGEQSGNLDQQLSYLAEEYRERLDHVVATISEIIKPLVMLLAGALFILMIVALFLPIYQLIGQVN